MARNCTIKPYTKPVKSPEAAPPSKEKMVKSTSKKFRSMDVRPDRLPGRRPPVPELLGQTCVDVICKALHRPSGRMKQRVRFLVTSLDVGTAIGRSPRSKNFRRSSAPRPKYALPTGSCYQNIPTAREADMENRHWQVTRQLDLFGIHASSASLLPRQSTPLSCWSGLRHVLMSTPSTDSAILWAKPLWPKPRPIHRSASNCSRSAPR